MLITRRRGQAVVAVLFALIALTTWQLWPTSTAATTAPRPTSIGKLTLATIAGTTLVTPVLAFSNGGSTPPPATGGGGAGSGKFSASAADLAFATGSQAPLLLRALATGTHLQTATVVLYAAGTTRRAEQWTFSDATVSSLQESDGAIGKPAKLALALTYGKVTWTTYNSAGAMVSTYCFDMATNAAC